MKFSDYPVVASILVGDDIMLRQDSSNSEQLITFGNLTSSLVRYAYTTAFPPQGSIALNDTILCHNFSTNSEVLVSFSNFATSLFSDYTPIVTILDDDIFLVQKNSSGSQRTVRYLDLYYQIMLDNQYIGSPPSNTLVTRDANAASTFRDISIYGTGAVNNWGSILFPTYPGGTPFTPTDVALLHTAQADPDMSGSLVARDQGGLTGIASVAGFTAGVAGFRATLIYNDILKIHAATSAATVSTIVTRDAAGKSFFVDLDVTTGLKVGGYLSTGTYVASPATSAGYITIKDVSGNLIKLMVGT